MFSADGVGNVGFFQKLFLESGEVKVTFPILGYNKIYDTYTCCIHYRPSL